ncbi:MAG: nicotinate-nucleotide adenylyltransferase [Acidobacteriota bacterium]|jgi:nicotinate-nucleotide adenylyltransferase
MNAGGRLGLLGGTLDPIHLGHVETAKAARAALGLDRVIVLPSRVPPHRVLQPVASRYHRFAMVALAVNGIDGLAANDMELCAPGPSYTADTLARCREQFGLPALQLFFITGADAFAEIATWHRYPEVLELAHFVVVSRPGFPAETLRQRLPAIAHRMQTVPPADRVSNEAPVFVSSSRDAAIFLVNAQTPDVSSTEVRRRMAAGETLKDLLPAAVERHILKHGLYAHTSALPTAVHLHGEN